MIKTKKPQVLQASQLIRQFKLKSLEYNSRVGKLTTAVSKDRITTIRDDPSRFQAYSGMVKLVKLQSNGKTYVVDGGSALRCFMFAEEEKMYDISTIWVVVQEISVSHLSELIDIAVKANSSVPQKVTDLVNLAGGFNSIKQILKESKYNHDVIFKTGTFGINDTPGEGGRLTIEDVLFILSAAGSKEDNFAQRLFRSKRERLDAYQTGQFDKLIKDLPIILDFYYEILEDLIDNDWCGRELRIGAFSILALIARYGVKRARIYYRNKKPSILKRMARSVNNFQDTMGEYGKQAVGWKLIYAKSG